MSRTQRPGSLSLDVVRLSRAVVKAPSGSCNPSEVARGVYVGSITKENRLHWIPQIASS